MDPVAQWAANRQQASIASSILREKGVTSAWSIDGKAERSEPVLLGESAGSLIYHNERPHHARTPFNPPVLSGLGKIPTSAANGGLTSQPQPTFYGPYGDTWQQSTIDKVSGSRGSKRFGVFGSNVGGQGVSERAPGPPTPGPGAYDVQKAGIEAATKPRAPRAVIINETSLDEKQGTILKDFVGKQSTPGPSDYNVGPTHVTPLGVAVLDSTIGGALPTSTLLGTPQFTFTSKLEPKPNENPGPGAHRFDAFKTLSGGKPVVSETTLGRTATRTSAPVAVMSNRDPKHPSRVPRGSQAEPKKEDYRSNPGRWTTRVSLQREGELQTEMRMPVYSSFGSQKTRSQSAAFTMRALHVNSNRLSGTSS